METTSLAVTAIAGYLIGSIPFAYLVTRRKTGLDLRQHGTKNIGAANAYDVTGKRSIGQTVLVLDLLKGLVPVFVCELLGLSSAILVLLPALVLGHCYPIWLRFRGGRGLATTAGALLLVQPIAVLLWCIGYVLANRIRRDTHFAAIVTTGVCIAVLLFVDDSMVRATTMPFSGLARNAPQLTISILLVLTIILSRYVQPFMALVKGNRA